MEFNEKELRKEISYAIKNIHGIRHVSVLQCYESYITHLIINACESACAHVIRAAGGRRVCDQISDRPTLYSLVFILGFSD